jgi:hypothetical protein
MHVVRERKTKKQTKTKKQNELKIRKAEKANLSAAGKLKCRINKGQRQACHAVKRERAHNDTTGENNSEHRIAAHRIASQQASTHAPLSVHPRKRASLASCAEACTA